MIRRSLPVVACALGLAATPAAAQLTPAGDPFDVPSQILGDQGQPDLDRGFDGRFVVVWEGPDGSGSGVFGRRFDAAGEPVGGDFQVNVATGGSQRRPRVAVQPQGGFLVVWESPAPPPLEDNVYYRAYDPQGVPRDVPHFVHSNSFDDQYGADVAADSQGNFVVVWQTYAGYDPIYGRSFDAAGQPLTDQYRLDPDFEWSDTPAVVATGPGEFVVVYDSYEYYGGSGIWGQKFDLGGNLEGASVRFDPDDGESKSMPALGADATGNLLVAWFQSYPYEIRARRVDAVMRPRGGSFLLAAALGGYAGPAVAMAPSGAAVVTWRDASAAIGARFLPRDGGPAAEIEVLPPNELGWYPAVAIDATGAAVFGWNSWGENTEYDVRARRFLPPPPFFADGFESGDVGVWSTGAI